MNRSRTWMLVVVSCVGSGGCATDCCQDSSTFGVVSGLVVDGNDDPQVGVDVLAINFQAGCADWVAPGPFGLARTDAAGRFTMVADLFLLGPGLYCFDAALTKGAAADTVEQLQIRTYEALPPADTTRVTLVVEW